MSPEIAPKDMTALLRRWSGGDEAAFEELMEVAYDRMHHIASVHIRRERSNHTLQATAVLHEAVLRLMDLSGLSWSDRGHFFAMSAEMIRRIFVDYARQQNRMKRGGDLLKVTLYEASALAADGRPADLEMLDHALAALERRDPQKAQVVKLRFFTGLSGEEIARCLDISTPTVQREWQRAKVWLYAEMQGENLLGR